MKHRVYIKYMVSRRCISRVEAELNQLGIPFANSALGSVDLLEDVTPNQYQQFKENLHQSGLELLDDKKSILIEKIKNVITQMIHHSDEIPKVNYSDYISEQLGYDYTYLANTFSEVKELPFSSTSSSIKSSASKNY